MIYTRTFCVPGICGRVRQLKVEIKIVPRAEEEQAEIRTTEISDNIRQCVDLLENGSKRLIGYKDEAAYRIDIQSVYYLEVVDNRTFAYTNKDCFQIDRKLYELENILDSRFFRCSKSMIVNIRKIAHVRPGGNSRIYATLKNGEEIVISRSYVKEFKERLGIGN